MLRLSSCRAFLAAAAVGVAILAPAVSLAGSARSGASALYFDPSVRAQALGGGGALFWGGDPDDWANPALLPYHQGIRYSDHEVDLIPRLSDDTRFTSQRLTLAGYGIGVLDAGGIGLVDGARFDMGTQSAVDEDGNVLGVFEPWAVVESWGIGLSLVRVSRLLGWRAVDPERWDLSIGHVWKTYSDELAPDEFLQDRGGGSATAHTRDVGALVRWSPVFSFDTGTGWLAHLGGARLDVAGGWSHQNLGDDRLTHVDADQSDPIARVTGLAVAARLAGGRLGAATPGSWRELLLDSLSPLVSLALVYDHRSLGLPAEDAGELDWDDWSRHETEVGYGVELGIAGLFSYRLGHLDDDADGITGGTHGWSLGFDLGDVAGFRYDEATVPQSAGLDDVTSSGWTLYVDAEALARRLPRKGG